MRNLIFILVAAIVLIFAILLFGPKSGPATKTSAPKTLSELSSGGASVRLTTEGLLNGDDQHREIRVTVNKNIRTLDIIQGYNGHVIYSKNFGNNQTAYDTFLRGLDLAGFTRSRATNLKDERGVCPEALTFIYQLTGTNGHDIRLWSSDCGGGTLAGKPQLIQNLFRAQITNYDSLTSGVNL